MTEQDERPTPSSRRTNRLAVVCVAAAAIVAAPVVTVIARGAEPVGTLDDSAVASELADRVDGESTATTEPRTNPSGGITTGFDVTPPSATWARPALFAQTIDPAYGTPVRRVTSADGTRFDRNTYSRRQAENADGTRFMTYRGDATYRVYTRRSGALLRVLDIHPDAEPQWHVVDPDLVRHIAGSNASVGDLTYRETNVVTGAERTIVDLTDRVRSVFPSAAYLADRAEGSPSADGTRFAWIVHDADGRAIGIVSYDLRADRILGTVVPDASAGRIDWVSATPTGEYVVVGYVDRTVVFDADLGRPRRINDKADHSDLALTAGGRDAYVYIDFSAGVDGGWLVSVELDTLDRTRLFDLYDDANTSVHVSGKGYDLPGWVVVSTYDCKVPDAWSCDKVIAVELSTGLVVNLAHTYNCGADYWTEPHAVVNRAFTRVYFNSDAGSCGIDAEVYELAVPALPTGG